jgi:hypothetical protein
MTLWLHAYANDTSTRSRIENCLVCVIALGISCSKQQPRQRTTIQDAATKMRFYQRFIRKKKLKWDIWKSNSPALICKKNGDWHLARCLK